MSVAAVHFLNREQRAVGVWIDTEMAYLPGFPAAVADGMRSMSMKPDALSFEKWANKLADRDPTFSCWWETVEIENESPQDVLDRLAPPAA